jgi:hypothetical protein
MIMLIKEPITRASEAYAPSPWYVLCEFARQMCVGCIATFGPSRREEQVGLVQAVDSKRVSDSTSAESPLKLASVGD